MEPITVTIQGAKAATGFSRTQIYRLIKEGRLKAVKVHRRTFITCESIRELVAA